jgi:hypothetical protein
MAAIDDFLLACELHDPDRLAAALEAGLDVNERLSG